MADGQKNVADKPEDVDRDQRNEFVAGSSTEGKVTMQDDDELDDLDGQATMSLLHFTGLTVS